MGSEDLNHVEPNANISRNHCIQSMILESTSVEDVGIQEALQNDYREVLDSVEDKGGENEKIPDLLQISTNSVVTKAVDPEWGEQPRDVKSMSPEEREVIEQVERADQMVVVHDGSPESMRNADEVGQNMKDMFDDETSDLVASNDTTEMKSKLLSPNLSRISKESGIQIDQEVNEELPAQELLECNDSEKESKCEEKIKFTHWIVDFDDVSVADLLAHGEKNIIGECMTTLLKDFYSGVKKPRFEYKTGTKFQHNLKKKVVKKPKVCKTKEKGPCIETPVISPETCKEMYYNKFPNRKANYGYNRLHQMPVKCACRENKGNLKNDLFVQGTPVPIYKLVDDAMEEFKLHYL